MHLMAKVSNIARLKANFKGFPMVYVGHFYYEGMLTKIKMASKMAANFYKLEILLLCSFAFNGKSVQHSSFES